MFIPELIILPIDYDTNVNFIINYLNKDKQKNTTRPFYDKTITLYPELKDIADISDDNLKHELIRQAVIKRLTDNEYEIKKRIDYFKEKFNTFIYDFIEAQCKLYNYEWKESQPYIYCYVGYIPFYPRSAEDMKNRFVFLRALLDNLQKNNVETFYLDMRALNDIVIRPKKLLQTNSENRGNTTGE